MDGAVGHPEQGKIVVAGDYLMPGPCRDCRYVVGEEREGLGAAAQCSGPAGHCNDRAGLRNDAIARRLFIAPGTVKVHLSHIFGKLGITTRAELAAQAASRELTTGCPDE